MEIQLYLPSPNENRDLIDRFDLFDEINLPFLPQENNIYHSVSRQQSYKVISVHFTNKRIMVIVKETDKVNCYDGLHVYEI